MLVLGTGETLKRNHLPVQAPPKPSRSGSVKSHGKVENSADDVPTEFTKVPAKPAELDPLMANDTPQPPTISNTNHTTPTSDSDVASEPQANDVQESVEFPVLSVRKKAVIEEKKIDQENKIATVVHVHQKESSPPTIKKANDKIEIVVTNEDTSVKDDRSTLTSEQSKPTKIEDTCSKSSQDIKDKSPTQPDVKQNTTEDSPVEKNNPKATNSDSLIESDEPKSKPQSSQWESGVSKGGGGFDDYVFEVARSLGKGSNGPHVNKNILRTPLRTQYLVYTLTHIHTRS